MCQERIFLGVLFLLATIGGYALVILPGIVMHIISIVNAARYK